MRFHDLCATNWLSGMSSSNAIFSESIRMNERQQKRHAKAFGRECACGEMGEGEEWRIFVRLVVLCMTETIKQCPLLRLPPSLLFEHVQIDAILITCVRRNMRFERLFLVAFFGIIIGFCQPCLATFACCLVPHHLVFSCSHQVPKELWWSM